MSGIVGNSSVTINGGRQFEYKSADFTAFKLLTTERQHNLGTLELTAQGGLKCVGNHVFRPLNLFSSVSRESADNLRKTFERIVNDELDFCFERVKFAEINKGTEGAKELEGTKLQLKMEEIKKFFHKAIYRGMGARSNYEFTRSEIGDIISSVELLRRNLSLERLTRASVKDLCQMGVANKQTQEAAQKAVVDAAESGLSGDEITDADKRLFDERQKAVWSKLACIVPEKVEVGRLLATANKVLTGLQADMKETNITAFSERYPGLTGSCKKGRFKLQMENKAKPEQVFQSIKQLVIDQSKLALAKPEGFVSNADKFRAAADFVDKFVDAVGKQVEVPESITLRQQFAEEVDRQLSECLEKLQQELKSRQDLPNGKYEDIEYKLTQLKAKFQEDIYPQGYRFKSVEDTEQGLEKVRQNFQMFTETLSVDGILRLSVKDLCNLNAESDKAIRHRDAITKEQSCKGKIQELLSGCTSKVLVEATKNLFTMIFRFESDKKSINDALQYYGIRMLAVNDQYELQIEDRRGDRWREDVGKLIEALVSPDRGLLKEIGRDVTMSRADIVNELEDFYKKLAEDKAAQDKAAKEQAANSSNGGQVIEMTDLGPTESETSSATEVNATEKTEPTEPQKTESKAVEAYDFAAKPSDRLNKFIGEIRQHCPGMTYREVFNYVLEQMALRNTEFADKSDAVLQQSKRHGTFTRFCETGMERLGREYRTLRDMMQGVSEIYADGTTDKYYDYIDVVVRLLDISEIENSVAPDDQVNFGKLNTDAAKQYIDKVQANWEE